jgi:hypothetical protein
MCKVDGIEVTREDIAAWDAAVASFQRNLRARLHLMYGSVPEPDVAQHQAGDLNADLATTTS